MSQTIHAIYENGVFRPTESVNLPERCEVQVDVRQVREEPEVPTLDDVYAILAKRYNSGESDVAPRAITSINREPCFPGHGRFDSAVGRGRSMARCR